MSLNRYAKRRDPNEPAIVKALEAVGASVKRLDEVDLLIGWRGHNFLLEVKGPKGALKPSQEEMIRSWRGQYGIVRTADEALRTIGAIS